MRLQWFYTKNGIYVFFLATFSALFIYSLVGYFYVPPIHSNVPSLSKINIMYVYVHGLWKVSSGIIILWIAFYFFDRNDGFSNTNWKLFKQGNPLVFVPIIFLLVFFSILPFFLLPKEDSATQYKYYYSYISLILILIYTIGYLKFKNSTYEE